MLPWHHTPSVMKRSITVIIALAVVVSVVGAGTVAVAAADPASDEQRENSNGDADIAPGERLSGVVGVQNAEVEGELADRTFGITVAQAATDDAKGDVVAGQLDDVENRLSELEQRAAELEDARENGEISDGKYKAEMATIAAEKQTVERLADRSETAAGELPEPILEEKGIDVEAIQTLKDRANELGGPEIAEIARSIAGPDVGTGIAGDRIDAIPGDRGHETSDRDTDGEANTEMAAAEIAQADQQIQQADERATQAANHVDEDDDEAIEAVERAQDALDDAEDALQSATAAADDGAYEEAVADAERAHENATLALEHIEEAVTMAEAGTISDAGEHVPTGDNN